MNHQQLPGVALRCPDPTGHSWSGSHSTAPVLGDLGLINHLFLQGPFEAPCDSLCIGEIWFTSSPFELSSIYRGNNFPFLGFHPLKKIAAYQQATPGPSSSQLARPPRKFLTATMRTLAQKRRPQKTLQKPRNPPKRNHVLNLIYDIWHDGPLFGHCKSPCIKSCRW